MVMIARAGVVCATALALGAAVLALPIKALAQDDKPIVETLLETRATVLGQPLAYPSGGPAEISPQSHQSRWATGPRSGRWLSKNGAISRSHGTRSPRRDIFFQVLAVLFQLRRDPNPFGHIPKCALDRNRISVVIAHDMGVTLHGDNIAVALAKLAKHIEARRGAAQDIEWAISESDEIRKSQQSSQSVSSGVDAGL